MPKKITIPGRGAVRVYGDGVYISIPGGGPMEPDASGDSHPGNDLLMETGDWLLMETGDSFLMEA